MQNLVNITKDIYNEAGVYQISFYFDERTKEIIYPEIFTKKEKENNAVQMVVLEKLERHLQTFQKGKTEEMIQENIKFAYFLVNLNQELSLSQFTRNLQNKIMQFFTKLLDLLLYFHYDEEFHQLAFILFEEKLESSLTYNPKYIYEEIEQDKLGLVRSSFYYQLNIKRVQELKRMRNL